MQLLEMICSVNGKTFFLSRKVCVLVKVCPLLVCFPRTFLVQFWSVSISANFFEGARSRGALARDCFSDQGKALDSNRGGEFCELHNIGFVLIPGSPWRAGSIERRHRALAECFNRGPACYGPKLGLVEPLMLVRRGRADQHPTHSPQFSGISVISGTAWAQ